MGTTYRPRRQPCLHCGEKVVIIESSQTALGGILRRSSQVRVEHVDFVPGSARYDQVDDDCRRPRATGP